MSPIIPAEETVSFVYIEETVFGCQKQIEEFGDDCLDSKLFEPFVNGEFVCVYDGTLFKIKIIPSDDDKNIKLANFYDYSEQEYKLQSIKTFFRFVIDRSGAEPGKKFGKLDPYHIIIHDERSDKSKQLDILQNTKFYLREDVVPIADIEKNIKYYIVKYKDMKDSSEFFVHFTLFDHRNTQGPASHGIYQNIVVHDENQVPSLVGDDFGAVSTALNVTVNNAITIIKARVNRPKKEELFTASVNNAIVNFARLNVDNDPVVAQAIERVRIMHEKDEKIKNLGEKNRELIVKIQHDKQKKQEFKRLLTEFMYSSVRVPKDEVKKPDVELMQVSEHDYIVRDMKDALEKVSNLREQYDSVVKQNEELKNQLKVIRNILTQ